MGWDHVAQEAKRAWRRGITNIRHDSDPLIGSLSSGKGLFRQGVDSGSFQCDKGGGFEVTHRKAVR